MGKGSGKERGGKMHKIRRKQQNTHGNEMTLYKAPILLPISLMSEICATHGVTTLMKAPEQNPYSREYRMSLSKSLAVVQHAIVNNPLKNADGTRRLK